MTSICRRLSLAAVVALLSGTAACADLAASVRRHTYPPGFQYITREQLESNMWQLAQAVHGLRHALQDPTPIDAARRAEIQRLLRAMDLAARDLSAHGWPTNHPWVDANIDTLRADIAQAERSVAMEPPNYILAGAVSSACLYCHTGL